MKQEKLKLGISGPALPIGLTGPGFWKPEGLDPSLKGVRTASLLLSVIVVKRTPCFRRARPCAEYELGQIF